ncbi:MAG: UDP-N-acetylglucosamine--N-acetylmuramyl-(pentapeptide) pyrophosphoryl-undecaprenol N-acetylglucosamine transferase [Oscillospiraceae bacterium]|nr:UDP-N-acetylglucosamine--N-acetylmuramyl-(pentapeptide) pyrophosphoryl-undecaprenol N-acetylglucosamine transferase [Oscillospiraceae bacterium]
MNVIFTCGGTGGHINPAIAVANSLRERHPDARILFIGAKGHMEEQLVPEAGFELKCLSVSGMSRGKNLGAVKKNIKAVAQTVKAVKECKKIIREFGADAIIGTGGYACYPALKAGTQMKIPTCVHESNAMPGLTTRMLADKVSRMLICFPESAKHYKHPEKVETVGMPIRREFVYKDKAEARRELCIGDELVVVSAFGSLGARKMNETVAEMLCLEKADDFPFRHIHATGKFGWEWMPEKIRESGIFVENCPRLDLREYIYNMPTVMAAADLIISRAGASSCNEIAASGTPAILIPSPNVTDNHQEKNARVLVDRGGAELFLEKDCTAQSLYGTVKTLLADQKRRERMTMALHSDVILDSADRICDILEELTHKS